MTTILIIDDDEELTDLLGNYLEQFGMKVIKVSQPDQGLTSLREQPPSLIVLDLMLPGRDGLTLCREIRAESSVPIIMLTARGTVTDRVVGLEVGADDYITKPVDPRELVARIQTVLRRERLAINQEPWGGKLNVGEVAIDLQARTVMVKDTPLDLTTMEFELFSLFVKFHGQVLSRDHIMEHLRGVEWEACNRTIDVTVSKLRHKLKDDPRHPQYLKTIWGTGYLFLPSPNFQEDARCHG